MYVETASSTGYKGNGKLPLGLYDKMMGIGNIFKTSSIDITNVVNTIMVNEHIVINVLI